MSMMAEDPSQRPGYRGKCLYKTGKCNNERALKTSGQAHNLCDEHRHRQNEHQRKLDAKNRYARKDKSDSKDASPTNLQRGARYMPYGKVRMSPSGGGAAAGAEDVHALLSRSGIVPPGAMGLPFHPLTGEAMANNAAQMVGMGAPEMMANGVVLLPGGPQTQHLPYPMPMQDFDGIIVPLPSYIEGHERNEMRARVFQKVMDFIAEECVRRYGVPPGNGAAAVAKPQDSLAADVASVTLNPPPSDQENSTLANNAAEDPATKVARGKQGDIGEADDKRSTEEDGKDAEDDHAEGALDDPNRTKQRATRGRVARKDV